MTRSIPKHVRETLAKKHACYVLITCGEQSDDGQMQVEMSYEGDPALAAYLIEGAHSAIEAQID